MFAEKELGCMHMYVFFAGLMSSQIRTYSDPDRRNYDQIEDFYDKNTAGISKRVIRKKSLGKPRPP